MNGLRALEQAVLVEGREWTRARLEKQLQQRSEALAAVCPQSGQPLQNTRWRDLQLATVVGTVAVRVRVGYSPALGAWVNPAREAWGLPAYGRMSPELEGRLAYTATEVGSYERAARMAERWGSPVSDHCIHQHVQHLGAVESLGKQLQGRLRGCGQFWTRTGFTHLLRVSVLVKNKDDPLLWN